ncbi:MAG: putative hydrolase or acyltransferase of alpha/beta superfamily [Mycobacterium sp.]|jgi:esterase|nr:putative hydrolase or acyltransferase of alpha/beta superfamily [Mycobacterium sp.]MDT5229724.1 esterase [Mycobacterium sp.]
MFGRTISNSVVTEHNGRGRAGLNFGVPQGQEPSTFSGPVLVMSGGTDPVSTHEVIHAAVMPRFKNATLHTVGTAGH